MLTFWWWHFKQETVSHMHVNMSISVGWKHPCMRIGRWSHMKGQLHLGGKDRKYTTIPIITTPCSLCTYTSIRMLSKAFVCSCYAGLCLVNSVLTAAIGEMFSSRCRPDHLPVTLHSHVPRSKEHTWEGKHMRGGGCVRTIKKKGREAESHAATRKE